MTGRQRMRAQAAILPQSPLRTCHALKLPRTDCSLCAAFGCPRPFVLRTALRLLLALLLCLNGAVAPMAMAAMPDATVSAAKAESAEPAPHCHGDEDAAPVAPSGGGHDHTKHPSCCKPGHCACACAFSLDLPDHAVAGDAVRSRREQPLPRNVPLPALRDGVPLRPPIV
jgi:hypothetical protein